jgi:F0F1-type ATP synthase assembly protein I
MSEPERPSPGQRVKDRYSAKPMDAAYQGAVESVLSIVVGVLAGWWVDSSFETAPWGVLGGATIGFGAFVLRLSRLGAALNAPAGDSDPAEPGQRAGQSREANASNTENHDRPR